MNLKPLALISFFAILFTYFLLIFVYSALQVIDDHSLLNNLMSGGYFTGYLSTNLFSIGRFYPLNMQEFNLLAFFLPNRDVFYFYMLIATEFLVLLYTFFLIFKSLKINNNIYLVTVLLFIFTPACVTAFYRLHIGERHTLLFFVIFLFLFIKYQSRQKLLYFITGFFTATIALYYKEPAFLMLGSFAFFHLIFGWKELNIKQRMFDILLMFSASAFLLVYYLVVYINKGDTLYGTTTINPILLFAKNGFNYGLNDPLLIFILLPLVLYRIYIIFKSKKADMLYDSLLFSSAIYVLVFFKLNMFAYHYLLPAYAFGLIAVVYFLVVEKLYKKIVFKTLAIIAMLFVFSSSLPTGLALISHYKNVPHNFQNTLTFLTSHIQENSIENNRTSIFLDGVNRNGGEVHNSFIRYLEYRGLSPDQFDIKTDEDDNGFLPIRIIKDSLYTVQSQSTASSMKKGDLIVVTPYTLKEISLDKKEILAMQEEYELLFHADSILEIPQLSLKTLAKYMLSKRGNDSIVVSQNMFQMPLDFYVFRKN